MGLRRWDAQYTFHSVRQGMLYLICMQAPTYGCVCPAAAPAAAMEPKPAAMEPKKPAAAAAAKMAAMAPGPAMEPKKPAAAAAKPAAMAPGPAAMMTGRHLLQAGELSSLLQDTWGRQTLASACLRNLCAA